MLPGAIASVSAPDSTPVIIYIKYNPSTVKRSLQPQMSGSDENSRTKAFRFTAPTLQIIKVNVEIDATDAYESGVPTAEEVWHFKAAGRSIFDRRYH